jgi:hypothetical protein
VLVLDSSNGRNTSIDAVDKENINDSLILSGMKCKMSMQVQEICDIMTAAHNELQRIEKRDELFVCGKHMANQLRGLQDKLATTLDQYYIDKIFFRAIWGKTQYSITSQSTTILSECSTSRLSSSSLHGLGESPVPASGSAQRS